MGKYQTPIIITLLLIGSVAIGYLGVKTFTTPPEATPAPTVTIEISEGLRKEQVAFVLAEKLKWSDEQIEKFVEKDTAQTRSTLEGYTAPGTYHIPEDASTYEVAETMRQAANKLYAPFRERVGYAEWEQALKVASIVEKEAVDESDRFEIAKEIWKNIDAGEPLRSDAAAQYTRDTIAMYGESWCEGQEERTPECSQVWSLQFHVEDARNYEWWQPATETDRLIDWEDFNKYRYSGLPLRAISNPGLNAIEAAVFTRYTGEGEVITDSPL